MNLLHVVQHTSADYLGLMEDHLEGRRIRFSYFRPFTEKGEIPQAGEFCDGLVLLGGGPWGSAGGRDVPTLDEEIALTRTMLDQGIPVVGIGLGAQILAIAAGGGSEPSGLAFEVGYARRLRDDALGGFLPERFPSVCYMRDRPLPPERAQVLAEDEAGRPAVFQVECGRPARRRAVAAALRPGRAPFGPAERLQRLQIMVREIEDALVPIMTGIIKVTGWMQMRRRIPLKLT